MYMYLRNKGPVWHKCQVTENSGVGEEENHRPDHSTEGGLESVRMQYLAPGAYCQVLYCTKSDTDRGTPSDSIQLSY